jgi:non-specific serine/threonine protein kinase
VGPALTHSAHLLLGGYGGQILLSAAAERAVRGHVPPDVDVRSVGEGRLTDLLSAEPLYQPVSPHLPAEFPPPRTMDSWRHNLPVQSSVLVGRSTLVREVVALLRQNDVRLVTLHGPGGAGKTRLSLQVGAELLQEYADGVFFVALAAVAEPEMVAPAIAQTLEVREEPGRTLVEALTEHLREKHLLLVLDNFEQVTDAARLVDALLATCPRLKVLVSSRILLHTPEEQRHAVPPLEVPDKAGSIEAMVRSPAITLFMQRAQAVQPSFILDGETAPAVAEICARLDGLPLAIELAAARIKTLGPAGLLAQLSSLLTVLTGGSRHLDPRQQTVRGLIDWSYTLLSGGEQALFTRLGVFVGGWTVAAAAAICPMEDDLPFTMEEGLASLVDKSLVQHGSADAGPAQPERYGMLEVIREYAAYALGRLAAPGEAATIGRQHASYYLVMAEEAEGELTGPRQSTWLERLEQEHDNLRTALRWARETGEVEAGLRLSRALWRFWWVRGHLTEGRRWLDEVLEAAGSVENGAQEHKGTQAKALLGAGVLAYYQGDRERAAVLYEEALALWRQLDDRQGISLVLTTLGAAAYYQGDYWRATALHEESLALRRELGDRRGVSASLANLASVAYYQGDYERATALHEESLALRRELMDERGVAVALNNLGDVARHRGDYKRATTRLAESLVLFQALSDKVNVATCLEGLAGVAHSQGQAERAARLFGTASSIREAKGAPPPLADRAAQDRDVAAIHAALGDDMFTAVWTEGEKMTAEQAIAYVMGGTAAI